MNNNLSIYDNNNIFAKFLRNEPSCDKIYEDKFCISFNDINPVTPVHALVIPKGEYISFNDFIQNAPNDFVAGFFKSVQKVASQLGLEESGYRIIHNHGEDGGQTVFHFHVHILGGTKIGGLA